MLGSGVISAAVLRRQHRLVARGDAVRLRLKAYVLDTRYEKAFETDVNLRIMQAFAEQGVLPPAILHRTFGRAPRPNPPVAS